MLGKLIKYDMKAGKRIFCAMYGFIILMAAIVAILAAIGGFEDNMTLGAVSGNIILFFYSVSIFLLVISVIAMFVVTVVWIILRYRNNILRDEGYLMHTLPISTSKLYFGKMISSVIWCVADVVVMFAAIMVAMIPGLDDFNFNIFIKVITDIKDELSVYNINCNLFILFVLISLYASLAQLFACMNIGYALPVGKSISKDLVSIVTFIAMYIIIQVISFIAIIISALISLRSMNFEVVDVNEASNYAMAIISSETVIMLILSVVFTVTSIKLMQKKLNLE